MGRFSDYFRQSGLDRGAIPENAERSFTGEIAAGLKAGTGVVLPKMAGQGLKATGRPGDTLYDIGQSLVTGAEERYNADPAGYSKSAYGHDKSDYNPLKYAYDAASMTPPSLAGAAAAIPVALFGAPEAAVVGAGMLASGALFGAGQFEDTWENMKKAGKSDDEAFRAGLKTGLIEGGGEAAANLIPGRFISKPFTKLGGKVAEGGIVKSLLGVKPFVKGLAKSTIEELPVEMGTEFGQGYGEALVEKNAGARPDADPYMEGLQGAMAASMMTGGHMAGAGIGGALKHRMTMKALTNPDTNPDSRMRALEQVGGMIDGLDPNKGAYWRLNGVNAIKNNQPIPLDDTFLSDLTKKAIPVEDVNLLEWNPEQSFPAVAGGPSGPSGPSGPGGGGPALLGNNGPGYIDAEYEDVTNGGLPGPQRLAIPYLPNDQGGLDNWFDQRGGAMQPQNLGAEDQSLLGDMVAARYGLAPGLEGAHNAASSPLNDHADPTEGQIQAGNYRKGHVNFQGLDVSIENPAGSVRSGKDADGKPWSTDMAHHYGYIKGTVGKDKDHIDTFIGNSPESQKVFVVDQIDPKTGKFDEHKVMMGFDSQDEATMGYLRNYDETGQSRIGAVTEMSMGDFKTWLKEGDTKKPVNFNPKEGANGKTESTPTGETGAVQPDNSGEKTPEEVPPVQGVDGSQGNGVPVVQSADVKHKSSEKGPKGWTQKVEVQGSTIKVSGKLNNRLNHELYSDNTPDHSFEIPVSEWEKAEKHGNPNYAKSQLMKKYSPLDNLEASHDLIRDAQRRAIDNAMGQRKAERKKAEETAIREPETKDVDSVSPDELTEKGIKYDVNTKGRIVSLRDGNNHALRDRDGTWSIYYDGLKREHMSGEDMTMREAVDALIEWREEETDKKPEPVGTDNGNTVTNEEEGGGKDEELTLEEARKHPHWPEALKEAHQAAIKQGKAKISTIAPEKKADKMKPAGATWTPEEFEQLLKAKAEDAAAQPKTVLEPQGMTLDEYGAWAENHAHGIVKAKVAAEKEKAKAEASKLGTLDKINTVELSKEFTKLLSKAISSGKALDKLQVLQHVADLYGTTVKEVREKLESQEADWRHVEEAMEFAVVKYARIIATSDKDSVDQKLTRLEALYAAQPNLAKRDTTTKAGQQFSTPAPLAYLMGEAIGISDKDMVYEPTAGNGMLVMAANRENTTVNEYDETRRANLEGQGFRKVSGDDILDPSIPAAVSDKTQDVIVANPPFGKAESEMVFNDMALNKKEHIIVADALEKMKDDGRAAFIIGGHNFKNGKMTSADWDFLNWLYKHYNVSHNIDINGDVYRRMGTSYPIRLIVVEGRKATPDENYSVHDKEVDADKEALSMSEAATFEDVRDILLEGKDNVNGQGNGSSLGDGGGLQGEEENGERGESDNNGDAGGSRTGGRDERTGSSGRGSDGNSSGTNSSAGGTGKNKRGGRKATGDTRGPVGDGNKPSRTSELTGDLKTDIKNALGHVKDAIDAALKGATNPNKLSMGVTVDDKAYAEIKKHLSAALEDLKKGFKDFMELMNAFADMVIQEWGAPMIPYATKFYTEKLAEYQAEETKKNESKPEPEPTEGNELQATYKARSNGKSSNKLIPKNMEAFIQSALDDLESRHGDIDEYVTSKLQYGSKDDLYKALYADQIDTVAMAIDNIDRGLGFINGSQTGAGKGRTVAAIMWYAKTKGLKSVFFTQQPKLFSDMYRDLKGIGHPEIKPYIIHGEAESHIYDKDNNIVIRAFPPNTKSRSEEYGRVAANIEEGLADYDTVFIPYSQITQANNQRAILRAMAPDSIIILDESHKATGEESNTSIFMQEILAQAPGVMYSSATFAKRPSSMPVYFRTNLGQTGMSMENLVAAVEAGGVPLQQIISAQLARSGQYIRFEMDVKEMEPPVWSYDEKAKADNSSASDAVTSVMRDIVDFSYTFSAWVENMKDRMNTGKKKGNRVNVTTSSFHSVAHNTVAQLLLGLKVETVAAKAIADLKADKKSLINLSNTMASAIDDIAEWEGIKPKDESELDINFIDTLRRTLRNQLSYTIKQPGQRKGTKVRISPNELPQHIREMYDKVMRKIDTTDVNIPASPIDMLRYRIEQAGYKVAEITGRNTRLDYSGGGAPIYRSMTKADKNRNGIVNGFNKGEIDCIIFNSAGSTGLSLHAAEDVSDQRVRKMLIAQADLNIDTVMQAMGRIFRTGQVEKPQYEYVLTSLPGEKRPAAILKRKLTSMTANTSADSKNAYTSDEVPDMLNIYGDKVMAEYLKDNADINRVLGTLVTIDEAGEVRIPEDLMRQATGRLALLPVALQEKVYDEITEMYNAEIDYLNKTGQNKLVASVKDYNAKTLEQSTIYSGDESNPNPFTRPAYLEKVLTKVLKRPHTIEEVREMADKELDGRSHREYVREISKELMADTNAYVKLLENDLIEAGKENKPTAATERKIQTIRENATTYNELLDKFIVGDPYTVVTAADGDSVFGVFLGVNFSKTAEGANPMVPSKIGFKFAVANGERVITIPMSKHELLRQADDERVDKLEQWDEMQKATTEVKYMITGNLLTGYKSFVESGRRPQIVMYSAENGTSRPGIEVPKSLEKELGALFRFSPSDARLAQEYLGHIKQVNANNAHITMTTSSPVTVMWFGGSQKWRIIVDGSPKNNQAVLDRRLLDATDSGRFDQRNGDWNTTISEESLPNMLRALEEVFSAKFNVPREFANQRAGKEGNNAGSTDLSLDNGQPSRPLNATSIARIKAAIERILPNGVQLELHGKLEFDLKDVAQGVARHGHNLSQLDSKKQYKVRARGSQKLVRLSTGELTSLIKLSMSLGKEETGYHEILHAAEALGVLTESDIKILDRAFPSENGVAATEKRADAFGDFAVGKLKNIPSPVRLVFQKIKNFLERVRNALQGLGFRTAEDVFNDLYSGKLKAESPNKGVRKSELAGVYKEAYGGSENFSLATDAIRAMERAIKESGETSKMASFASRAIDRAKLMAAHMGPLGTLPGQSDYLVGRYLALGKIDGAEETAREMHDALQGLSEEDAKAVYEYWTNSNISLKQAGIKDVNAQKTALAVKNKIIEIGRGLVERGLLDEKTYMENLGRYVPRVYLKHILGEGGFKALGTGRKASQMAYLKQRKDIPEEVRRIILSEIKDPGYLAARALSVPLRDMAILDWLEDVSKNKQWVLPKTLVEWEFPKGSKKKKVTPFWLISESERIKDQIPHMPQADRAEAKALADRMYQEGKAALNDLEEAATLTKDFVQLPNTARYGRLRGMYVRKEIHQDLVGTTTIFAGDASVAEKILGQGGVLTQYTQYWKWAKVAANPPAQVRNFISNLVLLHISGVPFHKVPTRIVQAIREIRGNGRAWQIAKKYGVRKATFTNEEMARMERELVDLEAKRSGKKLGWPQMKSLAMKIVNMTGDWYQFMEAVGKTAKILDELEKGASEKDAAMAAHSSLFDYSLVNPNVRYLRNAPIGVPFLTFLYKAVPMMADNFIKHPTRLIPYVAFAYGMSQLVASMTGLDDDDLEALRKALPDWLRDRNHTYLLPFKDKNNRWQFVDLGYFFPWTAVGEMAQNLGKGEVGKFLSTSGILGGPIPSMISAIQTNTDPFTKKQIVDTTSTPAQQAGQLMGYLYQLNMPTWLTNQGVAGKVKQALGNEVDKYGDPKSTMTQAGLRMAGVNLYAVEPTRSRERNISTMESELTSLKREKKAELKNPNLTAEDRGDIIKEYGKRLDKKKAEIEEYKKASRLSPAAM